MSKCIEWPGPRGSGGYGKQGRKLAHRVAWEAAHGPIPRGLFVLHSCDNPPCVNLEHLRLGTQQDNVRDREERNRRAAPIGELNGRARLTPLLVEVVRAVGKLRVFSDVQMGRWFGVSAGAIFDVRNLRSWGHL